METFGDGDEAGDGEAEPQHLTQPHGHQKRQYIAIPLGDHPGDQRRDARPRRTGGDQQRAGKDQQ